MANEEMGEEIQDYEIDMDMIPLSPDGYVLGDVKLPESFAYLPESFKKITFDKQGFADIVHKYGLTKAQAKGLWEEYTKLSLEAGEKGYYEAQVKLEEARIEELERQENEETEETASEETLQAKGDYHLTKEEAQAWRDRITNSSEHAYWDEKAPMRARDLAVAFVQRLDKIIAEGGGSIEGYITELDKEKKEQQKAICGYDPDAARSSSNGGLPNQSETQPAANLDGIGYGEKEVKSGSGSRIEDV